MSSKSSESGDASASMVCVECGGSMIPNQKKICTSCDHQNAAMERKVKIYEELFNDDKMFADPPPKMIVKFACFRCLMKTDCVGSLQFICLAVESFYVLAVRTLRQTK